MVRPGAREIMVGKAAQGQLAGMQIGDKVILPNGALPIVGVFSTGGDVLEGQLIADRDTLMGAVKRDDFNIVLARLDNAPDAMDKLKSALTANRALPVMAERRDPTIMIIANLGNDRAPDQRRPPMGRGDGHHCEPWALRCSARSISWWARARLRRQEIGTLRALGFRRLAGGDLSGEVNKSQGCWR